jgi:anti-anti-sigma factor
MNLCPAVRRWVDFCLSQGATQLRVNLHQCGYMDSTFVGTLLSLYRRFKDRGPEAFTLIAPSPPCCHVLRQMHLYEIFNVTDQPDAVVEGWRDLPLESDGQTDVLTQAVKAHQELASLPGEVGASFRPIAEEMAAEMPSAAQ